MRWFDRLRRRSAPPATPLARALAALDRGDPRAALAALDDALAQAGPAGERVVAFNKRAVAHVALGNRDAAVADLTAALDLDPRFVPAITNLGNLLLEAGDVDEAIVHYEAALRIDDDYVLAVRNLGIALKRAGRRAEAVRALRRADRLAGRRKSRRGPAEGTP